ncbi:uncharacterized protein LOC112057814 [Bicyclus anynana]|nr:uncharacterized protein LOC112057814 [Bicyclus anynana]
MYVTEEPQAVAHSKKKDKDRRSAKISTQPTMEEICHKVMLQVGDMVNARLASLEDRLLPEKRLRPPLSGDKKKTHGTTEHTAGSSQQSTHENPLTRPAEVEQTAKPSAHDGEQWAKVSRRKTKKKEKQRGSLEEPSSLANEERKRQPADKSRKLRSPRSAAIVLTLQPGAEEKGATYAAVLKEAKEKIDLSDLGITALRFRRAATGGRILEVPGATSEKMADSLAHKLREVISEEFLRVSRPVKCVDMRVSGLDDSVSNNDVVAEIASRGGCTADQIRFGEIKRSFSGLGTLWLRCPVTAAKKVAESGRLLVGWVSVQIKILDERPRRCYRCLESGHLIAQCSAEVDRSDTCYRCGQAGHKARECSAAPHCRVCEDAGRPANHLGGSRACNQSTYTKKKSSGKIDDGPRASSQSARPTTSAAEDVTMSVG